MGDIVDRFLAVGATAAYAELREKHYADQARIAELERQLATAISVALDRDQRLARAGSECSHIAELLGSALSVEAFMGSVDSEDVKGALDLALEISRLALGDTT